MSAVDDRGLAVRQLLDAAAAARARGDWSSAVALAEAASGLQPDEPEVVAALSDARAGLGAGTAASGTRRQLSVVFCDLVGSTQLASKLDPEDWREILNSYHETCAQIVRRYDGHIGAFLGDGVLVYFGYPRAHEDDELRAVLASLAMVEAVGGLTARKGAPLELKVRVGIHTGLTVLDYLEEGPWVTPGKSYGGTPNVAARVQAAAPPGAVVVTADTLRLLSGRLDVEPLGAHELKGIDDPVELFRVVSVHAAPEPGGGAPDNEVTGRQAEREALERAWAEAPQHGGYVLVTGEPGIGKSHLARYARGLLADGQGTSLVLRCSALHENTPLHPVVELLLPPEEHLSWDPEGGSLERLAKVLETAGLAGDENLYLMALMCSVTWPAGRAAPDLQPEQSRERTLALLTGWVNALAASQPLLLVVEDLHWADPSTLELLRRCVAATPEHPLVVLVTTRLGPETALGEPTTVLALQPLGPDESQELVDRLTGGRLDAPTQALVAERGEGVPLYIRELAKMLESGGWSKPGGAGTSLPLTLQGLLVARLDAFPHQRQLLHALAVLGGPAGATLLGTLARLESDEAERQLGMLEQAGILRSSATPPQYDFYHALLREAAYGVQLFADRRRLHRRAADELQAMYASTIDEHAAELAHHYELAGEFEPAVTLWMQAALRQASFAAHAEAVQSFGHVLKNLPHLGRDMGDLELRAQSGLAASLLVCRGYSAPEVGAAYGRLRELATAGDAETELSSLFGLWSYYHVTGDAAASVPLAEAFLASAQASGDQQVEWAGRAVLGYQLMRLGRPAEAVPLLRQGRQWRSDEPFLPHHAGIGAGANLAMAEWLVGDFAAARASVSEAVAGADMLEGPTAHFTRAYVNLWAAELYLVAGQPEVAARFAGRAVEISSEFGFASWLGAGMAELKIAEALLGDADALPAIAYCLAAWRGAGAGAGLAQFGLGLALAYRAFAREKEALGAADTALADARAHQELYLEPELLRVRGELLMDLPPEHDAGLESLEQAVLAARQASSRALELKALLSVENRYRQSGSGRSAAEEIASLVSSLDPEGDDPEPLLGRARSILDGGVPS